MSSNDAVQIPQTWVDLNTLSGFAKGSTLFVQNVGYPGDLIELYFSDLEPATSVKGWVLDQVNEYYVITGESETVWARFFKNDRDSNLYSRVGFLQVVENV